MLTPTALTIIVRLWRFLLYKALSESILFDITCFVRAEIVALRNVILLVVNVTLHVAHKLSFIFPLRERWGKLTRLKSKYSCYAFLEGHFTFFVVEFKSSLWPLTWQFIFPSGVCPPSIETSTNSILFRAILNIWEYNLGCSSKTNHMINLLSIFRVLYHHSSVKWVVKFMIKRRKW